MATGGLSEAEVDQLRADVSAGRLPRVRISGAGEVTAGTVRAVGDPASDGEDYVTVRVKLNGVTDDLRFAPRELSRGRQSAKAEPVARPPRAPRAPREPREPREPAAGKRSRRPATVAPVEAPTPEPAPKRSRPARRATTTAPVTITLSSVGASWTLSAQRGARSIVKSAAVNPGVVSALAGMLELPAVDDAVAAVNDTARAEAQARAEQLRAELAELEAVLDSHRRP